MKKVLFGVAASLTLFSACGDDSSNSVSVSDGKLSSGAETLSSCSETQNLNSSEAQPLSSASVDGAVPYGSMTDSRDGRTYRTVTIDSMTWMLDNLAYKYPVGTELLGDDIVYNASAAVDSLTTSCGWMDGYDGDPIYCEVPEPFQGICPDGWHLPTMQEAKDWRILVSKNSEIEKAFNNSTHESDEDDARNFLWTSSLLGGSEYFVYDLRHADDNGFMLMAYEQGLIRCVLGNGKAYVPPTPYVPNPVAVEYSGEYGSFTDARDNKAYKTVQIGTQTWMAENLNYDMGDSTSACGANDQDCSKFGRHYTWSAAVKACPEGWHLPSGAEVEKLQTFVENAWLPSAYAADDLLRSSEGWANNTTLNGKNSHGFNALNDKTPYDKFTAEGVTGGFSSGATFWTSSEEGDTEALTLWLQGCCYGQNSTFSKTMWADVRCLKD